MKISRKSWHKALNQWTYGEDYIVNSTNLCSYFWGTLLAIVLSPIFVIITSVQYLKDKIPDLPKTRSCSLNRFQTYRIAGICMLSVALIPMIAFHLFIFTGLIPGGVVWLILSNPKWLQDDFTPRKKKDGKPNMLVEMIKATKNRYCPRLEWVD